MKRVAVVDVPTGNQVGSTYEVNAPLGGDVQANSNGTRLVVTTESLSDTSTVTVIDTAPFLATLAP